MCYIFLDFLFTFDTTMAIQRLAFALCGTFALCGCQAQHNRMPNSVNPRSAQLLQQLKNIDAFPTSEHNQAKLFQQANGCMIEFMGFHSTGLAIENWFFKANQLLAAKNTVLHYADYSSNSTFQIASTSHNSFDIHNPNVQLNFQALAKNFTAANLAHCQ